MNGTCIANGISTSLVCDLDTGGAVEGFGASGNGYYTNIGIRSVSVGEGFGVSESIGGGRLFPGW